MKKLLATLCLTIAVLLGSAWESWSSDLRKANTAIKKRDYEIALRLLKPLSEQGGLRSVLSR